MRGVNFDLHAEPNVIRVELDEPSTAQWESDDDAFKTKLFRCAVEGAQAAGVPFERIDIVASGEVIATKEVGA